MPACFRLDLGIYQDLYFHPVHQFAEVGSIYTQVTGKIFMRYELQNVWASF